MKKRSGKSKSDGLAKRNGKGARKGRQNPVKGGIRATARSGETRNGEASGGDEEASRQKGCRRNGNVARLPKAARDRLNVMMRDGVPYREIIERLGEDGKGLDLSNLSRWKDGGHQEWLVEQMFVERTRARQETPGELVRDFDATEVNHAALQLGALTIFEALRDLGPGSLDKKLGGDSAAFVRLLNALARTSRETMMLQKYREACAKARAALHELKDPKRKLSDSERRAIVRHVDDILGIRSDDDDDEETIEEPTGLPDRRETGPRDGGTEGEKDGRDERDPRGRDESAGGRQEGHEGEPSGNSVHEAAAGSTAEASASATSLPEGAGCCSTAE